MKIFCIGRNYADHAREMGSSVPAAPMVFMKPSTALVVNEKPFYIPDFSNEVHYEAEIVLRICKNGRSVQPEFAASYYDAVTVGLDLTARDLQQQCKEKGHPWEIAKAFDHSAPVGRWVPMSELPDGSLDFTLRKNGEVVQQGNTGDLIFDFATLICHISRYFKLQQGDLVFTGTPAGVGPVAAGDVLEGFLIEDKLLHCEVR
ncbi:MAG: fumarylacetoacetate hydrolase family protein [Saprospiraceae bacterium]|nr:fumarylacetoacetate hydrolase family protein [Saprospiraceae bacterium]